MNQYKQIMRKSQLFLFHFAGGNCYSFQFLMPSLSMFEVIPLELPGRGKRLNEPLLNDFDKAAKDLYDQVMARLSAPAFLLYGHSIRLSGPGVRAEDKQIRHLLSREDFINEVKALGGLPKQVVENEELMEFFLPVLRADFEIVERNGLEAEPAIQAPLFAIMGSREDDVAFIDNWSKFTSGRFSTEILEGDHFFIHHHPHRIAGIINACYHELASRRHYLNF